MSSTSRSTCFRRFLQEYEIAQRINDPAVVRLHDLGIMTTTPGW